MPATLDIRTKRKAFKDGPDLWNAIVHGPREIFDRDRSLANTLIRHGFSQMPDTGERVIWVTPPAPVAPPIYLGDLLAAKHNVRMSRDTKAMVEAARGARKPEDSLERYLGPSTLAAGRAALTVQAGSRNFIANCDADDRARRDLLAGAGWLPVPQDRITPALCEKFGTAPHMTADPFLAANLAAYMAPRAHEVLAGMTRAARKAIEVSKSQEAPEGFDLAAPEGIDYLPFQKSGIHAVVSSGKSGIIADDMGLGKTVAGIGILNARPEARNILVVCQANMKLKWVREINKWRLNQDLTIGHAEGDSLPQTDIVVINYDIIGRHKAALQARSWDIILPDEAHNMKNHETQRTQAVLGDVVDLNPELPPLKLAPGGLMVHLTGTPKPNKIADLWPLLSSTRPDIWGRGPDAFRAFIDRYQPPKLIRKKMRKGNREYEVTIPLAGQPIRELELQLRMRGSGSFIRRMKRDTDLPPKFRTPIELPFRFSEADRKALAEIDADIEAIAHRVAVENGRIRVGERMPAGAIIDTITGMVPSSPHFAEGARVRANLGLLKAPYMARFIAEELLADEELAPELRRKTVVFAHHKAVIAKMAEVIRKDLPNGVLIYDGSVTSVKKKQELVDRFQDDPDARVFLMSKSGNSGITLTASHRMRIAEPDWDPANMSQIEDRIWRIGQEQNCDIGYLYAPGSHDMNIGEGLIRKMDVDERALNSFVLTSKSRKPRGGAHEALFGGLGPDRESPDAGVAPVEEIDEPQMRLPL